MCWLLRDVYPKSWTFQIPRLCQRAGAQKAGRKHGQESWSNQAKWIIQSTECHAHTINWGRLPGRQTYGLGMWLAWHQPTGSEQLYWIACFSWVFFPCVPVSLFFSSSLLLFTIAISISIIITPDFPLRVQKGPEQLLYDSCQLELNCDNQGDKGIFLVLL